MKRFVLLTVLGVSLANCFAQGTLTPTGAPGATMRTLLQIEPRTPISSLPVTLTNCGSYYLTSNLLCSAINQNGITISTNDITIDLNGFGITGPSTGSGYGIANVGGWTNITVRNGSVRDWPRMGINLTVSMGCLVENVTASDNANDGIGVGKNSVVRNCTSTSNGNSGIVAGNGSSVLGCASKDNSWSGITINSGGVAEGCAVDGNGFSASQPGIWAGVSSTVKNCSVARNYRGILAGIGSTITSVSVCTNSIYGISLGDQCTVTGSTVVSNGVAGISMGQYCSVRDSTVGYNTGEGITVGLGGTVANCNVSKNTGTGIKSGDSATILNNTCAFNGVNGIWSTATWNRIEGNQCTDNSSKGIKVDLSPNVIVRNSASSGTNAYSIVLGNMVGPTNTFSTIATNNNPNANFQY